MDQYIKLVSQRLEFFRVKKLSTGKFTKEGEEKLTQGLHACLSAVGRIDFEAGSEMLDMIQRAEILGPEAKGILNNIVDSKVEHTMPARGIYARAEKIKLRWIEDYQSANCWDVYGSNKFREQKLYRMAMLMAALGMHTKNLDETAFAEAADIALHTIHSTDTTFYLHATRKLKALANTLSQQMEPKLCVRRRADYPQNIEEFNKTSRGTSSHSLTIHGEAVHSMPWPSLA